MGKRVSILIGVIAFALVVFLGWKAFWTPNDRDALARQQEEKIRNQEEKIRNIEDRVTRLQQELEESSKQITSLQARLDETMSALGSVQRKVNSRHEETRVAKQNPLPVPRFYEMVRSTFVFEEPSASSRKVGNISDGTRVKVVGSTGDWLEVRSKVGRPPGFIRRDDAVLIR